MRGVSTNEAPSHAQLVIALRRVAAQVMALPAPIEGARVEVAADRLEASPADAEIHVELVQRALRSAQRALEKRVNPKTTERTIKSLTAFDAAVGVLDSRRGLRDQRAALIAALESLTNAVALLGNEEPPFPEPARQWPTPPPEVALANAREHALAMAAADFPRAGAAAGRVIEDLAAVTAGLGPAAAAHVTKLRFHAGRLRGQRPGILDEVRWISEALSTALAAVAEVRGVRTRDAQDAVANIEEARGLAFQRAAVQDAVRATISVFVTADAACTAPTTARAP